MDKFPQKNNLTDERLKKIHKEVEKLIAEHKPNLISVETLFFFKNLKTVMPVSQTKGVILLAAAQKKIPIFEFTPLQMKMTIVGYGRAEKKQVQNMIKKSLNLDSFDLKKIIGKKMMLLMLWGLPFALLSKVFSAVEKAVLTIVF